MISKYHDRPETAYSQNAEQSPHISGILFQNIPFPLRCSNRNAPLNRPHAGYPAKEYRKNNNYCNALR